MARRTALRRLASLVATASAAIVTVVATAAPGLATPTGPSGVPAMSGKKPVYTVQDPDYLWSGNCSVRGAAFTPLTSRTDGQRARVLTGVQGGASYQIEVPANWNGELVIYAHGYNGTGTLLCAGPPDAGLRQHYIDEGYAWAASSYADNGYDVAQGVKDSRNLIGIVQSRVGKPSRTYMTGVSMGGQITAVAIEQYRNAFDGAMPACGVLGGTELFDYFLGANVTAAALAGAPKPAFPADPAAYGTYVNTRVVPTLLTTPTRANPFGFTPTGLQWAGAVEQMSGGTRPGFPQAVGFWDAVRFAPLTSSPFLFGVYPGLTAGTIGIAPGSVVDNAQTVYQLDGDPAVSAAEQQLNASVLRVSAAPQGRSHPGLASIPQVTGNISIPVVTLHDLGDLFVPFSMEQVYAQRVAANGASGLLTQRAIRAVSHCDFSSSEYISAFDAMVTQVKTGVKPAGDVVTDPAVVAQPTYGCRFTDPAYAGTFRQTFFANSTACAGQRVG